MTEQPNIKTTLYVSGKSFSPTAFTRLVEVEPTESGEVGEFRVGARSPVTEPYWEYSERRRTYSVSEAVGVLTALLVKKKALLKQALDTAKMTIVCTVTIHGDRPVYDLKPKVLSELAQLGVEFIMDIYDYSDDHRL